MATARDDEVVDAVESIDGVESASVRLPGGVGSGHLRVVFAEGYDRSEAARRVARVLDERFGLHISPDAIERLAAPDETADTPHVAATDTAAGVPDSDPRPSPGAPAPRESPSRTAGERSQERPLVDRLEIAGAGLELEARAVLSLNGTTVEGAATGAATTQGRLRAAANATVAALQELLDDDVKLEIDELDLLGELRTARIVVTVTLLTWEGSETHVGVALVRDGEPEQAAMRATLDALNRRMVPLLRG